MHGSSFIKIVPVSNIYIIRKGAHSNFAMGATLHRYATAEVQYKPRSTGSVTFANLRSNVISSLCSKDF